MVTIIGGIITLNVLVFWDDLFEPKKDAIYFNSPSIGIADEAMIYCLDTSDTVWFKPCEGKRTFLGFYDKATNSIRLK